VGGGRVCPNPACTIPMACSSRGASESLLALHQAYLDQKRCLRSLRGELVASSQALSESRKAHRTHAKRARDLGKEAKLLRETIDALRSESRSACGEVEVLRKKRGGGGARPQHPAETRPAGAQRPPRLCVDLWRSSCRLRSSPRRSTTTS